VRPLRLLAVALFIAVAAALPYARTFSVAFQFDDVPNIVENPAVHALDLSARSLAPAVTGFPLHRWLARLTFAVNHALGGLAPAGYHALNLALHVLTALLVFALAEELLSRTAGELDPSRRRRAALLAALIFAVHPLQTMAVTYVVQRMALLSALFSLAALYCWARARRPGELRRAVWFCGAGLSAFLAISSKENAAVLPLLLLAFEAFVVADLPARARRRPRIVGAVTAVAVTLAAAAALSYRSELGGDETVPALSVADRLLTPRVLCHYLGRLVLPWPGWLHLDYGLLPSHGLLDPPTALSSLLGIGLLTAWAVSLRRRAPVVTFGVAFFLLALVVEQSVLPLDLAFEHRLYLPSFGLALAAGWGLERAGARLRGGPWLVALPVLLLLAGGAALRNEDWRDPVRLHAQDAAAFPWLTRALLSLGAEYRERGELDRAEETYRRLLELDPGDARAWSNLAIVALNRERPFTALGYARRAVELAPRCAPCRYNNALALLAAGSTDLALEAYRTAVAVTPNDVRARTDLGVLLMRGGEIDAAVAELRRVVATDPGYARGWANLSAVQLRAGQRAAALSSARQAVALDPKAPSSSEALKRALEPPAPGGP
jgi:tetratricopeptide (TPR) repeat protein